MPLSLMPVSYVKHGLVMLKSVTRCDRAHTSSQWLLQVWWGATLGIVLALSRAFVQDSTAAFQPELAMMEVCTVVQAACHAVSCHFDPPQGPAVMSQS